MIRADQIPDEVAEAVERLLNTYLVGGLTQSEGHSIGHALVEVALAAWPDRHLHEWQRPWLGGMKGTDIILPLPQEPRT